MLIPRQKLFVPVYGSYHTVTQAVAHIECSRLRRFLCECLLFEFDDQRIKSFMEAPYHYYPADKSFGHMIYYLSRDSPKCLEALPVCWHAECERLLSLYKIQLPYTENIELIISDIICHGWKDNGPILADMIEDLDWEPNHWFYHVLRSQIDLSTTFLQGIWHV